MSTQSVRNIINNQIDSLIEKARVKVEEEGKKQVTKFKEKIPTPKELVEKLKADINPDTCSKEGKEKFNKKIDKELDKLKRIEDILNKSNNKLQGTHQDLTDLIENNGVVKTINGITDALKPITDSLKNVIAVSPAALMSQMSLPVTGGPVSGLAIKQLSDAIDFAKALIAEFVGLVDSIPLMLNFYQNQAKEIVNKLNKIMAKIADLLDKIQKLKLYMLSLKIQFEADCAELLASGNSGGIPTTGITPPLTSDQIYQQSLDELKIVIQQLYDDTLADLIIQGRTKAVERIFTLTKELKEGYNISFKVIKI